VTNGETQSENPPAPESGGMEAATSDGAPYSATGEAPSSSTQATTADDGGGGGMEGATASGAPFSTVGGGPVSSENPSGMSADQLAKSQANDPPLEQTMADKLVIDLPVAAATGGVSGLVESGGDIAAGAAQAAKDVAVHGALEGVHAGIEEFSHTGDPPDPYDPADGGYDATVQGNATDATVDTTTSYDPSSDGGGSVDPADAGASYDPSDGGASYDPSDGGASYDPSDGGASYDPTDTNVSDGTPDAGASYDRADDAGATNTPDDTTTPDPAVDASSTPDPGPDLTGSDGQY